MLTRSFYILFLLVLAGSCGRGPSPSIPASPTAHPPGQASSPQPTQAVTAAAFPDTPTAAAPSRAAGPAATALPQPHPPLPIPVLALASDPFDNRAVYALLEDYTLYRTIDRGLSWERQPFSPDLEENDYTPASSWLSPDPGDLRLSPYNLGQLYLRAGGVLYACGDGGETWQALIDQVKTWFVDDEGTKLYAWRAGEAAGLYSSQDRGLTWQYVYPGSHPAETTARLFEPDEVLSLVIGNISDAELFASTGETIYRSPDGGQSWWEQPLVGLPGSPQQVHLLKARAFGVDLFALVQTAKGPFLARFDRGWVSPDQDHWTILGKEQLPDLIASGEPGLPGIFTLLSDPLSPERLYLGTTKGLLFSPDGGQTWEVDRLFVVRPVLRLALAQGFEPTLFAGTEAGVAAVQLAERFGPEPPLPAYTERVQLELVAQVGGALGVYAAADELVYAAVGPYLTAIDFGTGSSAPVTVWRSSPLLAEIRALDLEGKLLFAVSGDGLLHTYDLTRSREPVLISSVPISQEGVGHEVTALAVQEDLAAVVQSRCRGSRCQARLLTLDTRSPAGAAVTGVFDLPGSARGLYIAGKVIFVAYNAGLLAVDFSDPDAGPRQLVQYVIWPVRHAGFAGTNAYLGTSDRLEVLDLSGVLDRVEPYEIVRLGEIQADREQGTGFNLSTFILAGEQVYGFDTFGEFGHCWSSMFVLDVRDPSRPVFAAGGEDLPEFTCAGQPQATGNRLYVPDWDGLHLLDLSDLLKPEPLSLFPALPGAARLIPYQERVLYLASYRADNSLHLLDLREPANPVTLGPLAPGWTSGSAVYQSYLIVPAGFNGLQVVDLAEPANPQVVASLPVEEIGEPGAVILDGDFAYVLVDGNRLAIVDIGNPLQPALLGQYVPAPLSEPQVWISPPAVHGSYAYFIERQERDGEEHAWLRVVDVSDPAHPQMLGQAVLPGEGQYNTRPVLNDETAYLSYGKGIAVIDVSDPANPRVTGELSLPGVAYEMALSEPYLLIAGGQAGLWVADISDPTRLVLAGRYDTPGSCSQVAVLGETIYVNDGPAGALLLKFRAE